MIVDAIVVAPGSKDYTWKVAIPLFGGFPDSDDEAKIYKKIAAMENLEDYYGHAAGGIISGGLLAVSSQVTDAKTTYDALNRVVQAKKDNKDVAEVREFTRLAFNEVIETDTSSVTDTDFTVDAWVCETPWLSQNIKIGDTVYVGFYKNDMGEPIILGHRPHGFDSNLPSNAQEYNPPKPNVTVNTLKVESAVELPSNAIFKDSNSSSKAVLTLKDIRDAVEFYTQYKDALTLLAGKSSLLIGQLGGVDDNSTTS